MTVARVSQAVVETISNVNAKVQVSQVVVEVLSTVLEAPPPQIQGHGWKPRPWQQGSIGGHSFKRPS